MERFIKVCLVFITVAIFVFMFTRGPIDTLDNKVENSQLRIKAQEHVLSNGLKLIVVEDHDVPIIHPKIFYKTGSINERPGITGSAHLFEHMMFKGTGLFGVKNSVDLAQEGELLAQEEDLVFKLRELSRKEDILVKNIEEEEATRIYIDENFLNHFKGELELLKIKKASLNEELGMVKSQLKEMVISEDLWSILEKYGAVGINAATGNDRTWYYYSLPSNRIEMFFFIESDRMRNLILRELYPEIDVVLEEKRTRTTNSPSGLARLRLCEEIFKGTPYAWPIIGRDGDLNSLNRKKLMDFYGDYYSPNNAIIVLAGDITMPEAIDLTERYFGHIPRSKVAELNVSSFELSTQEEETRVYIEYPGLPVGRIGYKTIPVTHSDDIVLDVISDLLSRGKTSLFFKNLFQKKIASARAYNYTMKYAGTFGISFQPMRGHTIEEVERIIYDQIESLKAGQIDEQSLRRIKKKARKSFISTLGSAGSIANKIGYYEVMGLGWNGINNYLTRINEVTKEDVVRVASKYFTEKNRTVVISEDSRESAKGDE